MASGRSASAGAAEKVQVVRRHLQIPLHRCRMRIGQQRISHGNGDEVAEVGERWGLGAGKEFPTVAFHSASYVACPEPVQHLSDVTPHVEADPVRAGFQAPAEHGAQLRHLRLQRSLAHRPVTVQPCVQLGQVKPIGIQRQQREYLDLPSGEPQPRSVQLRAGLAEQLEFQ